MKSSLAYAASKFMSVCEIRDTSLTYYQVWNTEL